MRLLLAATLAVTISAYCGASSASADPDEPVWHSETLTLTAPDPAIVVLADGTCRLELAGFVNTADPGRPALPQKCCDGPLAHDWRRPGGQQDSILRREIDKRIKIISHSGPFVGFMELLDGPKVDGSIPGCVHRCGLTNVTTSSANHDRTDRQQRECSTATDSPSHDMAGSFHGLGPL